MPAVSELLQGECFLGVGSMMRSMEKASWFFPIGWGCGGEDPLVEPGAGLLSPSLVQLLTGELGRRSSAGVGSTAIMLDGGSGSLRDDAELARAWAARVARPTRIYRHKYSWKTAKQENNDIFSNSIS